MSALPSIAALPSGAAQDLHHALGPARFGCVLADPPWRFANRTGKVARALEGSSEEAT